MDGMHCRRRNKSLSILDLPDDILVGIFTTLPITTILGCRRVCKSWYLFFSSPKFADSYLANPPFTSLIVSNGELFSFLELNADYNYSFKSNCPKILPNPFESSSEVTRLVGSCNGFFCFTQKNKVHVSNPLTGTSFMLPDPGLEEFNTVFKRSYGFGFCPKTQQYKVIEIAKCIPQTSFTEIHVFTVGIDKNWRRVLYKKDVPFPKIYDITHPTIQFCEVNGKGILHWIAEKMDRVDYLYSFDITDEKVLPIPPPVGLEKRNVSTRSVFLHDCLFLLHKNEENNMEIWCMKEYMVPDSWTLHIIPQTGLPGHIRSGWFNPVAVWRNEEILMTKKPDSIFSCNVEQRIFTKLKLGNTLPKYYAASCFVPNFQSIFGAGTTVAQTQDAGDGSARIMKLPNYLLVKIFSRVPDNTILLCKCVCKTWYRFLSDPCFAESYYRFKRVVHLVLCDETSLRFLLELKSDADNSRIDNRLLDAASIAKSTVLGSCNGLICFSVFSDPEEVRGIFICNPLTRELSFLSQIEEVTKLQDDAYGFGFSPVTGDYKILRIFTRKWKRQKSNAEARVHTIGIDKGWRPAGSNFRMPKRWPDHINKSRFCDVPYNRAIHWIAEDSKGRNFIYAFDIDEEQVKSLPLPPSMEDINGYTCLVILRDCLCVFHPHHPNVVVWSMNTYGLVTSWTREIISLSCISRPLLNPRAVLPVTSWRDGDILLWVGNGTLMSYCSREKRCTEIHINVANNKALVAVPYMQSFLSLFKSVARYGHLEVHRMVAENALRD